MSKYLLTVRNDDDAFLDDVKDSLAVTKVCFVNLTPLLELTLYCSTRYTALHLPTFATMTTAVLPSLEPLFRQNAKRTRQIFESCPDEGLKDEEKRSVQDLFVETGSHSYLARDCDCLSKSTTNTETSASFLLLSSLNRVLLDRQDRKSIENC